MPSSILEEELAEAAAQHTRIIVIEMNDGQYQGEVQKVLMRDVVSLPILGGTIRLNEIREKLDAL